MADAELIVGRWLSHVASNQDLVSHNLANISTPGFKRQVPSWSSFDVQLAEGQARLPVLGQAADFSQGDVFATENPAHLAIEGPGFLKVRAADGTVRFTRGGEIHRDATGNLVDQRGLLLLDDSDQPVRGGDGNGPFRIGPRGNVSAQGGEETGRLALVAFDDPQALTAEGAGLWAAAKDLSVKPDTGSKLLQGSLERSNSESITELISMIKVQRSFQSGTRLLSSIESSVESLINSIK